MSKYLVIIEQGPTSFGAYVPDLPGCVAAAKSRVEVKRLIQEAVALHLQDMRRTGQAIPRPSSASDYVEADAA
ncbi:MAG: type II toxin-antitoxin system HicB family antitoxin [Phycisphaeraceae bacterium]